MYAIVEEGGKQYKVTSGETIQIDRPVGEDEKSITFPRVLLVGGDGAAKIGSAPGRRRWPSRPPRSSAMSQGKVKVRKRSTGHTSAAAQGLPQNHRPPPGLHQREDHGDHSVTRYPHSRFARFSSAAVSTRSSGVLSFITTT